MYCFYVRVCNRTLLRSSCLLVFRLRTCPKNAKTIENSPKLMSCDCVDRTFVLVGDRSRQIQRGSQPDVSTNHSDRYSGGTTRELRHAKRASIRMEDQSWVGRSSRRYTCHWRVVATRHTEFAYRAGLYRERARDHYQSSWDGKHSSNPYFKVILECMLKSDFPTPCIISLTVHLDIWVYVTCDEVLKQFLWYTFVGGVQRPCSCSGDREGNGA